MQAVQNLMVEDLAQRGSRRRQLRRQVKHLGIAIVAQDETPVFVVHADALRQIVQRGVQLDALPAEKLHDDGAGAADRHHEDNGEPDQIPRLSPPAGERGDDGRTGGKLDRDAGKPRFRYQPLGIIHHVALPGHVAARPLRHPGRQVADKGFSDEGIDMRIAREHDAVVTKQCGRLVGPACERSVGFLEVPRCDRADDQTEEFAVGSPEFTGEIYGPGAGLGIPLRFAEHRTQSRIGLQRLEIVLTCEIEWWGWPGLRRIDQPAVGADQHDRADVREAADLVLQHQVDAASHHGAGIELIGNDRKRFHVFDQVGLDEVDRLEVTRRLPGKHGCGTQQLLFALLDRVMTQIGQDQGDHADHQRDQECGA
jgi:hypothetical protein